jgi:IclR family acetate operon transcriptional repressor
VKTLATALDILGLFASDKETLSVGEIAAATRLAKSKVSKLLAIYREHGFLEQDAVSRRYKVGIRAFELGSVFPKTSPIAHDALPIMRRIADTSGHSTTLSIMAGDVILHVMAVEGPLYMDGRWRVGNRLAPHATSAGKVLLASLSGPDLADFISRNPLARITSATVTSISRLKMQLEQVRLSGLSITRGESSPGLAAIAVPVLGRGDRVVAALGMVVPDHLFDQGDASNWISILHDGARSLSMKHGASAYPYGGPPGRSAAARSSSRGRRAASISPDE